MTKMKNNRSVPTPKPKVKATRAWAVSNPLNPFAHCLCHNGKKMLMIARDKKAAETFFADKGYEVIPVLITPLTPKKKR